MCLKIKTIPQRKLQAQISLVVNYSKHLSKKITPTSAKFY